MKELLYISKARWRMGLDALDDISQEWAQKCADLKLTGVLLFDGTRFLHLLEGEDENIYSLFASIQMDERHKEVHQFYEGPIQTRRFDDWTLGHRIDNQPNAAWQTISARLADQTADETQGIALARMFFERILGNNT